MRALAQKALRAQVKLCVSKLPHTSSMERPAKRQKYADTLRRTLAAKHSLPYMSNTAFAAVIKMSKETDLSKLGQDRKILYDARNASIPDDTPYGPGLLSLTLFGAPPHPNRQVWVVNPLAYLHLAYKSGGGLFNAINDCLRTSPSTAEKPWRLVMYSDEITPGNALRIQNSRKVWVIYWSLLELGYHLGNEDAWCPMVAEPSRALKHVASGIGKVFCQVLKLFFGGSDGSHDFRAGIKLDGPGVSIRLFVALAMFLQDGGAHKMVWRCKGDGGTRLCMLCKTLVAAVSRLDRGALHSNLVGELSLASNADIKGAIARLKAFKLTESKTNFKLREQAIGFTLEDHNVLTDPALDDIIEPADQFCHDWMHGLLSAGVFNIICFLVLLHLSAKAKKGTDFWGVLDDYVVKWNWPRSSKMKVKPGQFFNKDRVKAYKKRWASEMRSF